MKYIIDIADNKKLIAEEIFKSIAFVKTFTPLESNVITNPLILKSIEDYESGLVKPTPMNLEELKDLVNAKH